MSGDELPHRASAPTLPIVPVLCDDGLVHALSTTRRELALGPPFTEDYLRSIARARLGELAHDSERIDDGTVRISRIADDLRIDCARCLGGSCL